MLHYEYFIVDEDEFINLWTFVWFTPEKCNQIQLVLVNQFLKRTQKWEHDKFVIEKFSNFHGCTLKFAFLESFPKFVTKLKDGKKDCIGYFCNTAEVLGKKLNYSYIGYIINLTDRKSTKPSGFYDLRWFGIELTSAIQIRNEKQIYGFYSTAFDFLVTSIVIPRGKGLDSYAKIIRPFDTEAWMWVAITFAAAFATIFVVKFTNIAIGNFIMGRNTVTPGLNVLRIFFGISQVHCPVQNFARFLMMLFILFCMVIRTAYQAKMFQFLQMDIVKPTFDTIDELIENNFTFFMRQGYSMLYKSDFTER